MEFFFACLLGLIVAVFLSIVFFILFTYAIMNRIYHGSFTKNADGTNTIILAGERCLCPTSKPQRNISEKNTMICRFIKTNKSILGIFYINIYIFFY